MRTKNYNIIPLSIDNGLNAVQVGTAGGYIRLLEAPAAANVFIHLNESNADPIPLKVYHAIEATDIERIFVTCNAVPGETIKIVQANKAEDFKMITPASDVKLQSLGSYESVALEQLDKIINPYNHPSFIYGETSSSSQVTLIDKTLECDKIKVILNFGRDTHSNNRFDGLIYTHIDGNFIASCGMNENANGQPFGVFELENIRGRQLKIVGSVSGDTDCTASFTLQEYTLK